MNMAVSKEAVDTDIGQREAPKKARAELDEFLAEQQKALSPAATLPTPLLSKAPEKAAEKRKLPGFLKVKGTSASEMLPAQQSTTVAATPEAERNGSAPPSASDA